MCASPLSPQAAQARRAQHLEDIAYALSYILFAMCVLLAAAFVAYYWRTLVARMATTAKHAVTPSSDAPPHKAVSSPASAKTTPTHITVQPAGVHGKQSGDAGGDAAEVAVGTDVDKLDVKDGSVDQRPASVSGPRDSHSRGSSVSRNSGSTSRPGAAATVAPTGGHTAHLDQRPVPVMGFARV